MKDLDFNRYPFDGQYASIERRIESPISAVKSNKTISPVGRPMSEGGYKQSYQSTGVVDRWFEDLQNHSDVMSQMKTANRNQSFTKDMSSVSDWFSTLDPSEKNATINCLLQDLSPQQIKFFAGVLRSLDLKHTNFASKLEKLSIFENAFETRSSSFSETPSDRSASPFISNIRERSASNPTQHRMPSDAFASSSTGSICSDPDDRSPSPKQREKGKIPEVIDFDSLRDIPSWLRSLRLHKYTPLFREMMWYEMIEMSDEQLQEMGVAALGARRKLLKMFQTVKLQLHMQKHGNN